MKNVTILFPAAAFWMFGVMGCEPSPHEVGDSPFKFLWIPKEKLENNAVFEFGRKGADAKAQELTNNGDAAVEVVYEAPGNAEDFTQQAKIVRSAKERGVSGVAVSCDSADGLKEAIDDVAKAGIPVMTFDSDSPRSDRFTYLGIDNEAAGALAAEILGTAMARSSRPVGKKVALVSGVKGAANLELRVNGFLATMRSSFPELVPLAEIAYCDDHENQAAAAVEKFMQDYNSQDSSNNIGGFFFVGHWPLHACTESDCSQTMPLWSQAATQGTVKTVAFDSLKYELAFVKSGQVAGLVGQRYWDWGADSIQMLYDRAMYGKNFDLSRIDSGLDVVCPNNVSQMEAMWDSWSRLTPQLDDCVIGGDTIR